MQKRLLVLTIQCAVVLIGLEFLFRLDPLPDPYVANSGRSKLHRYLSAWNWHHQDPPFSAKFASGPLAGVSTQAITYTINRDGFLYDPAKGRRNDSATIRIGVVGGSTVECIALREDLRWPNQMQHLLNEKLRRPVEVLNLGVSGQNSRGHLATVAQHAIRLELDYIIFLVGANDLFRTSAASMEAEAFYPLESSRCNCWRWLAARSQLVRRLRLVVRGLRRSPEMTADPSRPYFWPFMQANSAIPVVDDSEAGLAPSALAEYERDLVSLVALATAHGIKPVLVTQPMLWKPQMSPEEAAVDWATVRVREGTPYRVSSQAAARSLEALNRRLSDTCHSRGWQCIDLAGSVPRTLEYFYDSLHFNESGAQLVAQRMADFFVEKR